VRLYINDFGAGVKVQCEAVIEKADLQIQDIFQRKALTTLRAFKGYPNKATADNAASAINLMQDGPDKQKLLQEYKDELAKLNAIITPAINDDQSKPPKLGSIRSF
jgi:hypothetical protein